MRPSPTRPGGRGTDVKKKSEVRAESHETRSPATQQPELTDQQRALLTLLNASGIDGAALEALVLAVKSAGFDDLTLDDVRGKAGLQSLALHGLAQFSADNRWRITRKGKEAIG